MDIVYIRRAGRQDRMCIRGSRWFNTWRCYSVVEFYCSRQRNILFVVHLMELSHFSLFLWSLILFRLPSNYIRFHLYFSPSWTNLIWALRLPFWLKLEPHWLQSYFTPLCVIFLWLMRWVCWVKVESHWLHSYFTPSCIDFLWIVRLTYRVKVESHWLQ